MLCQATIGKLTVKLMTILLDSITDADATAAGTVVVSGSHGGLYPAALASRAGVRAVIFNDAGIGLENAGTSGVETLASYGMAAAAADCMSCRIGSSRDMMENGEISYANPAAIACGVGPGMPVKRAADLLHATDLPFDQCEPAIEARWDEAYDGMDEPVLFVDSASLVKPNDVGRIIVTGSHGGLIGGDPARALKTKARLAVFNDAGFGKDQIGVSRLPALDQVGVASVTVSHRTARIGDARSAWQTGIVSACNMAATKAGFKVGAPLRDQAAALC